MWQNKELTPKVKDIKLITDNMVEACARYDAVKAITKSKVGSIQQAQLLSVVERRHWYARYFSFIYSASRIGVSITGRLNRITG